MESTAELSVDLSPLYICFDWTFKHKKQAYCHCFHLASVWCGFISSPYKICSAHNQQWQRPGGQDSLVGAPPDCKQDKYNIRSAWDQTGRLRAVRTPGAIDKVKVSERWVRGLLGTLNFHFHPLPEYLKSEISLVLAVHVRFFSAYTL